MKYLSDHTHYLDKRYNTNDIT